MFRSGYLSILLLLAVLCLQSQEYHGSPQYLATYRRAEKWYHAENPTTVTDSLALNAYLRTIEQINKAHVLDAVAMDCYLKSGILQMTAGNNEQALKNFQQAIATHGLAKELPDSLLFQPYLYAGSIQYDFNNLDSAISCYKKAEAISGRYPALNEVERLYNKLGALYYETGDYKRSIPYYEKAISLAASKKPVDINLVVTYKNNIASSWLKLGAYNQALELYRQLLNFRFNVDQLYINISLVYLQQGDAQQALKFLRQVKQNNFIKYNNLSRAFISIGRYDSARYYNQLALNGVQATQGARSADYALALKYAGDIYCAAGKLHEGIQNYQSALCLMVPGFTDTVAAHNPGAYTGLQNFSLVFDILSAKATAFRILQGTQTGTQDLQHALNAYTAAMALSQHVQNTYASDDARLFLGNKVNAACAEAVSVAIKLYGLTNNAAYMIKASSFVESNKASVLQAALRQLDLTGIAGLPSDLLAAERKFKILIAKLSIQASRLRDSALISALQKKMGEAELQLSAVQEKLDDQPAYRSLKFNARNTNIDSARLHLDKQDAVLSYYYTSGQLVCFYATSEESGFTTVALPPDFFSGIRQLRADLESPGKAGRLSNKNINKQLYQSLLSPVMAKIKARRHLIVIPYNEICYLPFDILKDPEDGTLLLQKFDISYQYAAGFLADENTATGNEYKVLAMAPFATEHKGYSLLPFLPGSSIEIKDLKGAILTDAAATKSRFISLSDTFPVIHLATHAVASDIDPLGSYIEFFAEQNAPDSMHRLYEKEIYNLNLKTAKLVILSACETGNGVLVNGEGIVSLSRAFSYAGCKSVITSLWKADDAATAFIMQKLHAYLQKGYTKSEALQKARLDYLNNPSVEDRYKLPAYWAHLVLIGNAGPVVTKHLPWYLPAAIIAALFIVIGGVYIKRKRAR